MNIKIRPFNNADADKISTIICRNLREINSKDYMPDMIEGLINCFTSGEIIKFAPGRNMFVAEADGKLMGTASLAKDNRSDDEKYVVLTPLSL